MSTKDQIDQRITLITGATGYVGGRLCLALQRERCRIRLLARDAARAQRFSDDLTEIVQGDVLSCESLIAALSGVHTAYYLVHALGADSSFEEREYEGARNFATAARHAGVKRIVYLGGLAQSPHPSPHLRSRHQVGDLLRESGVQVIELRASIIIGSGSLSFELIRSLVERLPVMLTPRWVRQPAQPIAIRDVLEYLMRAATLPVEGNPVFEIGGSDRASYLDIMKEYAAQRGLRRLIFPVPVLTPKLSSAWLGLVTPLYARVGRKLIESVTSESVVRDDTASRVFDVSPTSLRTSIRRALEREERLFLETRWSDAMSSVGHSRDRDGVDFGVRKFDSRTARVSLTPPQAFAPIAAIGGRSGWYYADVLWSARGFLDLLFGGAGTRRGRRHPTELHLGDTIDFWRVERYDPPKLLCLRAEMKLPGRAWLQFEVTECEGGCEVRQTALFDPHGLLGLLYWHALTPIHFFVFRGMLRGIVSRAMDLAKNEGSSNV